LLRYFYTELQSVTATVARYGLAAETLHQEELQATQERIALADSFRRSWLAAGAESPLDSLLDGPAAPLKVRETQNDEAQTARVPNWDHGGGADSAPRRAPSRLAVHAEQPAPRKAETAAAASSPPTFEEFSEKQGAPERRKIFLADRVSLDATIVPETAKTPRDVFAAVTTPELYYIPRWDHFAVRVGAVVFHGNVGHIYPASRGQRAPERVKECRRRGACPSLQGGAPCSYYHDPVEAYADGGAIRQPQDVRNFIADSWVYSPATPRYGARYGSRRIGSRDALTSDLQEISAADARRFFAQTAHDILCSIVLAKYVLSP